MPFFKNKNIHACKEQYVYVKKEASLFKKEQYIKVNK